MADPTKYIFPPAGYANAGQDGRRLWAVNAALELIAASVGSAAGTRDHLENEMNKLSKYADLIQAAAEGK